MSLGVEGDDLELDRLTLVDDVARMSDALVRQLGDVDQTLEAVAHSHEGAKVDELGDRAVDDIANLEVGDRGVPRVRLELADRQADAATLMVDVDDFGLDLVADLVPGLRVVDLVPRELALVDEAVDPAEVDEDAERRDRADGAADLLADLEAAEELVPLLAALLVQRDLLGQDQAVGLAVDLEDLEAELAAHVRLQLFGDLLGRVTRLVVLRPAREIDDLADRDEAADAAVDDEAALVVVDDGCVDDRPRLELLLHRAPLALEPCASQGQDRVALLRFRLQDVDENHVPDSQLRRGFGMPTVELAVRDDTFALGPDVDENLVSIDPNDGAFDDVTVLEASDIRVLLGQQLLHGGGLRAPDNRHRRAFLGLVGLLGGRRVGDLRFAHRDGFERSRGGRLGAGFDRRDGARLGGLVGDRYAGGLLGRLVSDGGGCLHLRRGPARLLLSQGYKSPNGWSLPRKARTARASLKPLSRSVVRRLRALGPLLRSGESSAIYLSCRRAG